MAMSSVKELKQICNSRMKEILSNNGLSYDEANKKQRSRAFVEFYIKDILAPLASLDPEAIDDGLKCDGSGDLNVDFAYQDEHTYMVFQSKYIGVNSQNRLSPEDISHFYFMLPKITDAQFRNKHGNTAVKDVLSDVKKNSRFQFYLITTDELTQRLWDEADICEKAAKAKLGKQEVVWEIIDASKLRAEYKRAVSMDVTFPDVVNIHIENLRDKVSDDTRRKWAYLDVSAIVGNEEHESVICTIKGTSLRSLFEEHHERLFNFNIRGFLGANKINEKIKKTINDQPENFYYFNNGISAICQDMVIKEDARGCRVECHNFQIINGAQTVSTIGTYKEKNDNLSKVRVLLRITKGMRVNSEKGINRDIVKYNNSQSTIKASDFRSNDNIQIDLQHQFNERRLEQRSLKGYRKIFYARKRNENNKGMGSNVVVIDLTELARVLCAYKIDPAFTQSQTKLTSDGEGGLYNSLFGRDGEECDNFTSDEFVEIGAIVLLWLFVKNNLAEKKKELQGQNKEIDELVVQAKWHILFCFSQVVDCLFLDKEEKKRFYKKIVRDNLPDIQEKSFVIFGAWFLEIYQIVKRNLNVARRGDAFDFRNWKRNIETTKALKSEFEDAEYIKTRFALPF